MTKNSRDIIAYVMAVPPGAVESIRAYEKREKRKFRVMLIRDTRIPRQNKEQDLPKGVDVLLECDFTKPNKIAAALQTYQKELRAITCRSDKNIARFISIIPHVPYLRTPSTESLTWATDKLEMRRRFALLAKKFSPKYAIVKNSTVAERRRIIKKLDFP